MQLRIQSARVMQFAELAGRTEFAFSIARSMHRGERIEKKSSTQEGIARAKQKSNGKNQDC